MRAIFKIFITFLIFLPSLVAQEVSLKEKAIDEFKKEHYKEAIILLKQALETHSNDPEIYYYLGFFNHYQAYDSRPLSGYDFSYSSKIFKYFEKALELKPDYGNAKYFYGVECSANARRAMQNYDVDKLKYFYQLAFEKGAYPEWLLEYGKNMLKSCDKDAILFTGGNADLDVCTYLQLHRNFRTDITLIPIGYIDRPWYVKFLKNGLKDVVKKINLNLTDNQIYDMHPFKWKTTDISITVSVGTLKKYELDENHQMQWTIEPDLTSNRIHSKIEAEKAKNRTYLSPQKAILLQIVEDNFQDRPIYFSNSTNKYFYGGLDTYFMNCGLVSELTPLKTELTNFENDYKKIAKLLQNENLKDFSTLTKNNIPRISRSVSFSYYNSIYILTEYYNKLENQEKYEELLKVFKHNMMINHNPDYEQLFFGKLKN